MAVPILRYAGAIASILFLFSLASNTLAPALSRTLAAAPMGYGVGGGAGGGDGGEPVAPPEALAAAPAGTPMAEMPAAPQDSTAPTAAPLAKSAPPEATGNAPVQGQAAAPIPAIWLMVLGLLSVLAVGLSLYLDRLTRRNFRSRFLEK